MVLLRDAISDYLQHLAVERGFATATITAYRGDLGQLLAVIGEQAPVERLTLAGVRDYLAWQTARGYAARTQARRLACLCGFARWLVLERVLPEDPTAGVAWPRWEPPAPELLSHDEIDALLAAPGLDTPAGIRDTAMLELLYATGARVSEACGLDLADLDLDAGAALLHGKGAKERVVPVRGCAAEALQLYLAESRPELARGRAPTPAVLLNMRGGRLTRQGVYVLLRKHARAAGIRRPISPHKLRHSFATHMLAGGAGLRVIQELLGHADLSTTQVYTRVEISGLRREYDEHHPRA